MKISNFLRRLIGGDKAVEGGVLSLRQVIVWLFIALVALFLTHPASEQHSLFDKPLPMPAELGLDGTVR